MVAKPEYVKALEAVVREYEQALADQAALESRVSHLRQSILHLTKLCGYEPTVPFGLTEACRVVLQSAPAPLTAVGIRDRLQQIGFDLDRYANPLAAIHTTLKRMTENGDAEPSPDETSRTAYVRRTVTTRAESFGRPEGRRQKAKSRRRHED